MIRYPTCGVKSEFNHDWVHWPLKEKHIYEDWKANTNWGRLFATYQQQGYLAHDVVVAT